MPVLLTPVWPMVLGALIAIMFVVGGCGIDGKKEFEFPKLSLLTETPPSSPDAEYASAPPCMHPGPIQALGAASSRPCSSQRLEDVTYWTSRSDRYRSACKGQHTSYCNAEVGMTPHCHGFGAWRYCHSHPGGDQPHDHLDDAEGTEQAVTITPSKHP